MQPGRSSALARPQSSGKPRHAVTLGVHDEAISSLAQQGLSGEQIAQRVGCSHMTAKARLKTLGIALRRQRNPSNAPVTNGSRDDDILALLDDGLHRRDIAGRLGCNLTVLCHRILAIKAERRG